MLEVSITRTFTGSRHTGYLMTNEADAVAVVREGKRGGYFVQVADTLIRTDMLLDARDLAIRELS